MKTLLLIASATIVMANNNPTTLKDFAQRPATPAQNEVSMYLADLQVVVVDARRHAAQLNNMAKSPFQYDWNSHSLTIGLVREEVNKGARIYRKLETLKATALPWQQYAIERAGEALARLARTTEAGIKSLNRDRRLMVNAEYLQEASAVYQRADELVALIDRKRDLHSLAKRTSQLTGDLTSSLD